MIIDFNKQNGGSADLSKYWTSAQTESAIEQATEDLVTSGEVQTMIDDSISGISIDLSDYYTSAQTESAITEAVDNARYIDDVGVSTIRKRLDFYKTTNEYHRDVLTSIYYKTINNEDIVSELTGGNISLPTSADVQTMIEGYNYITSSYTGFASEDDFNTLSGIVQTNEEVVAQAINDLNTRINNLSGGSVDLSGYYTSAQTEEAITARNYVTSGDVQTQIDASISGIDLSDYWTSAQTQEVIDDINEHIDDFERVTAIALNDLNDSKVSSTDISTIVKISQSDYDALVSGGTVDNSTFYIITGSTI